MKVSGSKKLSDADAEKADKKARAKPAQGAMEDKETCGDYLLMDIIGRGAFGVVFRAVHRHRGNWVAIKNVRLNKKKKSQLHSLMMEIDLLKMLQHRNIVHYIDHVCTDLQLSIIMEYVENGSLESLLRKHGRFPESLVAAYMAQVVEGLAFLHDQCVIHRDIKGANILITTAGHAKLADFGVSTKLSDISNPEDSFAGTPYWMAPEIITMAGATTACDIWSVGCTIIELLTGTPPYGNLPAAASLYRIVQDDHPPLPEGITPALHELLLLCFQKDVDRRITADKLMKHPWIGAAKQRQETTALSDVESKIAEHHTKLDTATAMAATRPLSPKRKEEPDLGSDKRKGGKKEAKKEDKTPSKKKNGPVRASQKDIKVKPKVLNYKEDSDEEIDWGDSDDDGSAYPTFEKKPSPVKNTGTVRSISDLKNAAAGVATMKDGNDEEEEDSWYSDDDDQHATVKQMPQPATPTPKKNKASSSSSDEGGWYSDEDDAPATVTKRDLKQLPPVQTPSPVKPKFPAGKPSVASPLRKAATKKLLSSGGSVSGSDNEAEFVEGSSTVKVRNLSPKTKSVPKLKTPVDSVSSVSSIASVDSDDFIIEDSDSEDRGGSDDEVERTGLSVILRKNKLEHWGEEEEENDFLDGLEMEGSVDLQLRERSAEDETEDVEEVDPFEQIMCYGTDDADAMLQLQKLEQVKMEVQSWISKVNHSEPDASILNACNKLIALLHEQPDLKQHVINNATIIQTVNLLETCEQRRDVLLAVLQLVNEMLRNNVDKRKNTIQTNFCLLGGIPAVTRYASPHYPKPLRLETANFINQMSGCNPLVLHMFIACGGLSVLTTLLETNYNAFKTLIQATINSIWNIFHIQILPKNDFCHLFSKCGLMDRLATALGHFYYDSQATEYLRKTCDIMFYFSQASLDSAVQKSMCTTPVLARIKAVLDGEIKPEYHILWLLHTVRNLSMHINARSALEAAGFIPVLVRFLRRTEEFSEEEKGNVTKYVDERENVTLTKIHNQVLNTMLNICNMDYGNNEKVALAGILPSLMWFIEEGSVHFLKELSLKLFLAMPHSSGRVRELLWDCDAFPVYMRLLQDGSWYVDVLQCLLKWRRLDSARMDAEMVKSVEYLVDVFCFCGKPGFQKALEPLLDIVQESVAVNVAMREGDVIPKILVGLTREEKNPHAQCTLLKILLALLEAAPKDAVGTIVHEHQLVPVIRQIHATTTKLLVKNIAQRLLAMKAFQ